ncbi:hypothetical protein HN682_05945, partial [Candidatus Peregrinibacteria bacterium]|nr:hypothetical protein [Candidatus Peregrinibacteria bacterium]
MARLSNKKKAESVRELWQKAASNERQKWRSINQRGYDFYLNDQLTAQERDDLQEAGMPDFIINRITPAVEMMKFFVTANSPRWQAVGAEGSDVDIAAVHSDIASYCWYISNGKSLFSQVVQDSFTKGIGYMMVDIDADRDRGMGEVVFKRIEPFDVYVDPMSRDFLFRDVSYIVVKKDLPKNHLINLLPDHKAKIKKSSGSVNQFGSASLRDVASSESVQFEDMGSRAYLPDGKEDDIVDFYEMYSREKLPFYNIFMKVPPSPEEMDRINGMVEERMDSIVKELTVAAEESELRIRMALDNGEIIESRAMLELEKLQKETQQAMESQQAAIEAQVTEEVSKVENKVVSEDEYKTLINNEDFAAAVVDLVKFHDTRVKVTCVVGDTLLYEHYLANTDYPIVPFPYTYTGTPYAMSAVTPLVGKQQEINKSHQIMLHNANLSSNLRWLYEEGSVPEDEWEKYSSSPGALLKFRQGFTPPTPVQPLPLNSAFFSITQQGKQDIEYISGIPGAMQGVESEKHETYRGMLALDEYGTRRIKAWSQTIMEPALEHLGKIFMETAQNTYTAHKVFRIIQPGAGGEGDKNVEINVPIYNDFGDVMN